MLVVLCALIIAVPLLIVFLDDDDPEGRNFPTGIVGLRNGCNRCWMNAVLQCISQISDLKDYFVDDAYLNDINRDSPTQGHISEQLSKLLKSMHNPNLTKDVVSPNDFYVNFTSHFGNQGFVRGEQSFADEFFQVLMQALHRELEKMESIDESAQVIHHIGAQNWYLNLQLRNSFPRNMFSGIAWLPDIRMHEYNQQFMMYGYQLEPSLEANLPDDMHVFKIGKMLVLRDPQQGMPVQGLDLTNFATSKNLIRNENGNSLIFDLIGIVIYRGRHYVCYILHSRYSLLFVFLTRCNFNTDSIK